MRDTIGLNGCDGTMITSSGRYFNVLEPDPALIEIEDIAAALSRICRFGGHTKIFYSVAEHSVLAAHHAWNHGEGLPACRAILLHDATEAYLGDVVKPLKNAIADVYGPIEKRMSDAIGERFDIDFDAYHDVIKRYDYAMLFAEKRALFPEDATEWAGQDEHDLGFTVEPWRISFDDLETVLISQADRLHIS